MYCNCFRNPDEKETARLRSELRLLEREYPDQTPFHRRKDLILINQLRQQLEMPQVDANLQPIVIAQPAESSPITTPDVPSVEETFEQRDRLRSLILSYAVSLHLTMMSLASRIREYLKVNQPLDALTEKQLQILVKALKQELDALLVGQDLAREYNSTDNGKRVGFTLGTIQRLVCSICGKGFPIEGGPYLPGDVPYIFGGLMFMTDEKGAAQLYHGYPGEQQSCYGQAIQNFASQHNSRRRFL